MTSQRRAVGALRLVAAVLVLATIVIQITDRMLNNSFDPGEYFSYFTIESALITIVVLSVGGWMALRMPSDTILYTTVRMTTVAYAMVTAAVYNLLLRNVPYEGFVGLQWPNEVLHVWIPLFIVLDWVLSPGRPALPWRVLPVVLAFPVAWIVYTLIRGAVVGVYPYPFLDPATGGWISVILYIVGLSAFLIGLAAAAIAYSRRRGRSGLTPATG